DLVKALINARSCAQYSNPQTEALKGTLMTQAVEAKAGCVRPRRGGLVDCAAYFRTENSRRSRVKTERGARDGAAVAVLRDCDGAPVFRVDAGDTKRIQSVCCHLGGVDRVVQLAEPLVVKASPCETMDPRTVRITTPDIGSAAEGADRTA